MKEYVYHRHTSKGNVYIVYLRDEFGKKYSIAYSVSRYGDVLAKKLAYLSLKDHRKYYDYFVKNSDGSVSFYVYSILYGICKVDIDEEDFELVSRSKICIYKDKYTYYAWSARGTVHRLVLGLEKGNSNILVDHIDKNGLNDRKLNLRKVDTATNNKNSKLRVDNKTGIRGVYYESGKRYSAYYTDFNKKLCKKSFSINKYGEEKAKELAIKARLEAEEKYGYIKIDESSETNPNKNVDFIII